MYQKWLTLCHEPAELATLAGFCDKIAELVTQRFEKWDLDRIGAQHLYVEFVLVKDQPVLAVYRPNFETVYNQKWFTPGAVNISQGLVLQYSAKNYWLPTFTKYSNVFGNLTPQKNRSMFTRIGYVSLPKEAVCSTPAVQD